MAPQRTLVLIALACVLVYCIWGIHVAGSDATPPPGQEPMTISGGHAAGHRYTTPSWTLAYDYIEASSDSTIINARGIHDAVIFRSGKPYLHLQADHIEANLITKDFAATGHLRAAQTINDVTRSFATGSATWSEATQQLQMPNLIRTRIHNSTVLVHGLVFDVRHDVIHLGAVDGRSGEQSL